LDKKKVLLIKLSALGDVLFNIPLANLLKDNHYEVTWLVSEKGFDVINGNPAVDKVILAPLNKWKNQKFSEAFKEYIKLVKQIRAEHFDIAIDSQGLLKSFIFTITSGAKRRLVRKSSRELSILGGTEFIDDDWKNHNEHIVQKYLKFAKHLGLRTDIVKVTLPEFDEKIIKKVDKLFEKVDKSKPILAISPATTWDTKHWNKDNWKNLVKNLEQSYTLIFTGEKKNKELIDYISDKKHISFAGKTNLLELAEVYKRCDMVISLDSGSTHLAWATQKPKIVTIFCSTPYLVYGPYGNKDKYASVTGTLPCQPCHKKHCPMTEGLTNQCTFHPSVEEVYDTVIKLMQKL